MDARIEPKCNKAALFAFRQLLVFEIYFNPVKKLFGIVKDNFIFAQNLGICIGRWN